MASKTLAGRYEPGELLSTTPMSQVRIATDSVLERRVVVKLLAPNADHARFEREAHAVAGLAHPNIVQLFDYGHEDGTAYMVLEYLPGGTLADRLERPGGLADDEVADIAADVANGLEYAHRNGIVHRDLKPANILFDVEGRAKIGDLGIASVDTDTTLTEAGTVLGTAGYISPEQAAGEAATPASDVYSFGVTLFQMLTGRLPFESGNSIEIAAAKRQSDPPSIRSIRSDAPEPLTSVAMAALARRPEHRPADGAALVAALGANGSPPVPAAPAPPTEPATEVLRRRRVGEFPHWAKPLVAAILLALLVGAGVVIAGVVARGHGTPSPPATSGAAVRTSTTAGGRTATSTSKATTASTSRAPTQSTRPAAAGTPTTTPVTSTVVTDTAPATSTGDTTGATTTAP
jgi:eukaryotic-like serine/threonine-protein kinase